MRTSALKLLRGRRSPQLIVDRSSDPWSSPIAPSRCTPSTSRARTAASFLGRGKLLEQAGLPASFTVQRDYEPGYGND